MQTKCCTKCGEEKPLDKFSKDRRDKSGRQPKCKSCNRAYYLSNREKILSNTTKRQSTAEAKSKKREYDKIRRETTDYDRQYLERNREKVYLWNSMYRAPKLEATPDWLNKAHHVEMEFMFLYNQIMPGDWHVDHIFQLANGGEHAPWNLRVLKGVENLSRPKYEIEDYVSRPYAVQEPINLFGLQA